MAFYTPFAEGDPAIPSTFNDRFDEIQDTLTDRAFSVKDYGAVGDGVTDDTSAVSDALDALIENGGGTLLFPPKGNYVLSSILSKDVSPYRFTGCAIDAKITVTFDGLVFDLNPDRVTNGWNGGDADTKRFVRWCGGHLVNTAATKTASIFIRAWGMRDITIEGTRPEGWWKAFEIAGKDTYRFDSNYFFNNQYDIYHPTDAVSGITIAGDLPLEIILTRNHHSTAGVSAVFIGTKVLGFKARDCSFNSASATGPLIHLQDSSLLYGEGYSFSGCHFEQFGSPGAVHFEDTNSQGFYGIDFDGACRFVSADAGWKGVILERARRVKFGVNVFRDGSGGTTEVAIEADANCRNITVSRQCEFLSVTTPITVAAARSEYTVEPELRTLNTVVTGYNAAGFSDATDETLDMSTLLGGSFPTVGVPKGYWIQVYASDSGSAAAAANSVFVKLRAVSASATNADALLSLAGAPDGERRQGTFYVPADSNGDIEMDRGASGAGTLTISMYVQAVVM